MNPANPPQLKVFLSHTNEFSEYPKDISYVAKAKQAVVKSGYQVVEMGDFSAQSTPPEVYDACRVKECDVYLGILGMRYGTLTSQDISHTEHEYNTALEQNKEIFVFILDQKSEESKLPAVC